MSMLLNHISHPIRRSTAPRIRNSITHRPKCLIHPSPTPARPFTSTLPHLNRHKLHIGFTSLSTNIPFSQTTPTTPTSDPSAVNLDPRSSIMLTALRSGVCHMDCPASPSLDGSGSFTASSCWDANRRGEIVTGECLDRAWDAHDSSQQGDEDCSVRVTTKLGYRAAVSHAVNTNNNEDEREMEGRFEGDARVGILDPGTESESEWIKPPVALVHNLNEEYVLHALRTSPLVERYKLSDNSKKRKVEIISLAHNPETQISAFLTSQKSSNDNVNGTPMQQAHQHMKQCLTSAFVGYEHAVNEGLIDGYGVDSNGLSLPIDHDLHFSWRDVLGCAADAYLQVHKDNAGRSSLTVIRMPGNLLETRGLEVAQEIHSFFEKDSEEGLSDDHNLPKEELTQRQKLRQLRSILPTSIQVTITRPLTAFPHGGTGWEPNSSPGLTENSGAPPLFLEKRGADGKKIDSTHPIRILDYRVESGDLGQKPYPEWTNYHYNRHGVRPSLYQGVLNAALSHFDADSILEASKERELTVEERETLDGCKLLRDMIHDLDAGLDTMKSFAAYEEYLVNVAVPLLYGSFEELDEESVGVLQAFFAVHGAAVRMVVARWTRELLLGGWKRVDSEDGGSNHVWDKDKEEEMAKIWQALGLGKFPGGYEIPEDVALQEFSLKYLMDEESVGGIVVGCSQPDHVLEALRAADSIEK